MLQMEQFFINELQRKILPDLQVVQEMQSPLFVQKIEQFNFLQLQYYIQQCSAQIQETNDQKSWIYLGLLLKQVLNSKTFLTLDQYNKFAIDCFVYLIQILNIHFTSNYIEQILITYFEIIDRVDDQFWIFLAWQFRNAANNINQLELLRCLVTAYKNKNEFIDILILKIKIEIEKPINNVQIHNILLSSLQFALSVVPEQIIQPTLFQYVVSILQTESYQQVSTKDLYYVIGLIDCYFEKQHLIAGTNTYFEQFTTYVFQFILSQIEMVNWQIKNNQCINKDRQKENLKLITKLCQNHYALTLFAKHAEQLLNILYVQLTSYIELYNSVQNDDTFNELIDLISKQESDTYLCSMVRLFVAMCSYVKQFAYFGFLFCSQIHNIIFEVPPQEIEIIKHCIKFTYDQLHIDKVNQIIKNNSTLPITQLQVSLILLASMKSFIVEQPFLLRKFEQLIRIHLSNFLSQTTSSSFKIIFMLFLQKYQKKIFKSELDEQFNIQLLQYILTEILLETAEREVAIQVFTKITKAKDNYSLIKDTIQTLNPVLIKIISCVNDSEFFLSLINLATVHKDFFQSFAEGYLIALQQRIILEINTNSNYHVAIKMLQAYCPILKILPQECIYNSQLDIWQLIAYLPHSKKQSYDEQLIDICKLYMKYNQNYEKYTFILTFVFEQLNSYLQQPSYIKLLASITTYSIEFLEDEMPLVLYEIMVICLKCLKINYLPKKIRNIWRNIGLKTQVLYRESFAEIIQQHLNSQQDNIESTFFLITYLCISNQEQTERYHDSLVAYVQQIREEEVTKQNQKEIFDCCLMLIKLYQYTTENFGKSQLQFANQMLIKVIELLHACLLVDDKENQKTNKELNDVYQQFQEMISKISHDTLKRYLNGKYDSQFKLSQLMQARSQFGLINTIYNKFKN